MSWNKLFTAMHNFVLFSKFNYLPKSPPARDKLRLTGRRAMLQIPHPTLHPVTIIAFFASIWAASTVPQFAAIWCILMHPSVLWIQVSPFCRFVRMPLPSRDLACQGRNLHICSCWLQIAQQTAISEHVLNPDKGRIDFLVLHLRLLHLLAFPLLPTISPLKPFSSPNNHADVFYMTSLKSLSLLAWIHNLV